MILPCTDVGRSSPTPVAMMVYDEDGVPSFDTTGMPYSKAKAKAYGQGPGAVIWPPYPQGTGIPCGKDKPYGCPLGSVCQQTPEELYQEVHVQVLED